MSDEIEIIPLANRFRVRMEDSCFDFFEAEKTGLSRGERQAVVVERRATLEGL